MSIDMLGSLEQFVLLAVLRLGENAFGLAIIREIEEATGKKVSRGAVYVTLERLADKGYLSSRHDAPDPIRGGRPKRFFRLEADGAQALRDYQVALGRMQDGLVPTLGW